MGGSDERTGRDRCSATLASKDGFGRTIHFALFRALTDETLAAMERELAALYSGIGRPSIAPQMLLRAMLLQAFYSVRSIELFALDVAEHEKLFLRSTYARHDPPSWRIIAPSFNYVKRLAGQHTSRLLKKATRRR